MKIYAVIRDTAYTTNTELSFFTSHEKALGYILGIIAEKKESLRGYYKKDAWYNSEWCYDESILANSKHWNDFKYVLEDGRATLRIEQIDVW